MEGTGVLLQEGDGGRSIGSDVLVNELHEFGDEARQVARKLPVAQKQLDEGKETVPHRLLVLVLKNLRLQELQNAQHMEEEGEMLLLAEFLEIEVDPAMQKSGDHWQVPEQEDGVSHGQLPTCHIGVPEPAFIHPHIAGVGEEGDEPVDQAVQLAEAAVGGPFAGQEGLGPRYQELRQLKVHLQEEVMAVFSHGALSPLLDGGDQVLGDFLDPLHVPMAATQEQGQPGLGDRRAGLLGVRGSAFRFRQDELHQA
uniref:Uncharacterized protein n=1 Tax=Micrurus corallinus TaxID=54390 RepID=A0A2D4G293_MICCO